MASHFRHLQIDRNCVVPYVFPSYTRTLRSQALITGIIIIIIIILIVVIMAWIRLGIRLQLGHENKESGVCDSLTPAGTIPTLF